MKTYKDLLYKYLPTQSVPLIFEWLEFYNVQLKINRTRITKLGDYRPPLHYKYHRISVNHDLNKYHFLLTLVHEFAHLKVWEKYKKNVKPHGIEWKTEFRELMQNFTYEDVFPKDILNILNSFLYNPSSPSVSKELLLILRKYDINNKYLTLEELPDNSVFQIYNGLTFIKFEKMRKRYKCKRLDNNRIYLVNPLMKVVPVKNKLTQIEMME